LSVRLRVLCGEEVAMGPGKSELLRAIAETGSITRAAKTLGISYMHAWSLVQTMNACFRRPLVLAARGGQKGGGTGLTEDGKAVLSLYRETAAAALRAAVPGWDRLREHLMNPGESTATQFSVALSTAEDDDDLVEQSIRNELPGIVKSIVSDKVMSEVIVETDIGEMASIITTRSVEEMELKVGDKVAALVKATNMSVRRRK
jgi:molybdate transport system regulatory protein